MSRTIKRIFRNILYRKDADALLSRMDAPIWEITNIVIRDDSIDVEGWALPFRGSKFKSFTLNDESFDVIIYPREDKGIGRHFWYVPDGHMSGFYCHSENLPKSFKEIGAMAFGCRHDEKLPSNQNYYAYYCLNERIPLPPAANRSRVHGSDNELSYLVQGYSAFVKLELALQEQLGLQYKNFRRILDWGCGSGRVARYFGLERVDFTGVDIDEDNIAWCSQRLGFGHFQKIPLHPPTQLPDSSFDLLIGVSIFTHLGEKVQFEWLGELQRISAKDAVLLMTIHGNNALCHVGRADTLALFERSDGFLDMGATDHLKGFVKDEGYYRTAYHSTDYIMKHWSKFFEILRILPGYIGNNQDLVIMRKN